MKLLPIRGLRNHKHLVAVGYAKVDNDDYEKLIKYNWHLQGGKKPKYLSNVKLGSIHRFIMKCPKNKVIDHINGDVLDNRKINLRICSQAENVKNNKMRIDNKSGYKCIFRYRNKKGWFVQIKNNKKTTYIGKIKTLKKAIKIRNKLLIKLHGEYARIK